MNPDSAIFDDIDQAAEDAADAEALADLDAGRTISHQAVKRWLLSWRTPDELPPPRVGD
jgi:predicted transcriptional regulator